MQPDLVHRQGQYYRAFTAMFLHANFLHILFNMIALLIVGPASRCCWARRASSPST